MERGQCDRAETLLATAVRTCPSNTDARRNYAEALWRRDRRREALEQFQAVAAETPEDPTLWVRLAEIRLALGDTPRAMEDAQRAIALDPKLASAWAARGRIQRACDRRTEALADFHHALGRSPDDRAVQWELAETYRELHQPERSLAALHVLADSYPPGDEPQKVLYAEGMALLALGRADDAVESFTLASLRDKPTPEILYRLAEAQLLVGRSQDAIAAARQALDLDPTHQPSQHLLDRVEMVQQAGAIMPR